MSTILTYGILSAFYFKNALYVSILSFRSGLSQRYGKATMCMSAVGLRDTAVSINLSLASRVCPSDVFCEILLVPQRSIRRLLSKYPLLRTISLCMRSTVAPRFTYTQVFFPRSLSPKPAPSESVITVVFVILTTGELRLFGWSGVMLRFSAGVLFFCICTGFCFVVLKFPLYYH